MTAVLLYQKRATMRARRPCVVIDRNHEARERLRFRCGGRLCASSARSHGRHHHRPAFRGARPHRKAPGCRCSEPPSARRGIDEDTAFVLDGHEEGSVVGSGAVYIIDAREVTYSNLAQDDKQTMSAFGMKVHVLSSGDKFNLTNRIPIDGKIETWRSKRTQERREPDRASLRIRPQARQRSYPQCSRKL